MRHTPTLLGLSVLVLVIIGVGLLLFLGGKEGEVTSEEVKSPIPGTNVQGLTNESGAPLTLDAYEGRTRIINFWASWCPFCVDELPGFAEAQETLGEEVTVILVNRGESRQIAQAFLEQVGVRGELIEIYDMDDSFFKSIGGFAMPETLFINANDEVVLHKRGPLTREEILDNTRALLVE